MKTNILLHELPSCVWVNGTEYAVNWGFRAFIMVEICAFAKDRCDEQKTLDMLNIFYQKNIPPNTGEAVKQLLWFYRCGREPEERNKKKGCRHAERSYCFEQDAPFIYAAFRTQYGIDLQDIRNFDLHWWKFKAMFESLNEELKISKMMYYRTVDTRGMGKEQKSFMKAMKDLYALDTPNRTVDSQIRLTQRNTEWKDYVQKRSREVKRNG